MCNRVSGKYTRPCYIKTIFVRPVKWYGYRRGKKSRKCLFFSILQSAVITLEKKKKRGRCTFGSSRPPKKPGKKGPPHTTDWQKWIPFSPPGFHDTGHLYASCDCVRDRSERIFFVAPFMYIFGGRSKCVAPGSGAEKKWSNKVSLASGHCWVEMYKM